VSEPTDDEIMEKVHNELRLVSFMREPKDSRKKAAFWLAHKMVKKAREYLEEPYRKIPEQAEGSTSESTVGSGGKP
jgi:hypothetical protein